MKLKILVLKTLIISTFQICFFRSEFIIYKKNGQIFFESESPYMDCNKVIEDIELNTH